MKFENIFESLQKVVKEDVFTEEFKKQLIDEFEIAVNQKVQEIVAEKEEKLQEDLIEKVDQYLTYVSEEFIEENKKSIESEMKLEMSEKIIENVKTIFNEFYIDLKPEEKDVIASLEENIANIKEELNKAINKNLKLEDEIKKSQIKAAFVEETKDLTDVQKDEILSMMEGIDVDNVEDFVNKLAIVKEKYLKLSKQPKKKEMNENYEFGEQNYEVDQFIPDYLKNKKKFVKD